MGTVGNSEGILYYQWMNYVNTELQNASWLSKCKLTLYCLEASILPVKVGQEIKIQMFSFEFTFI